MRSKGPNRDAFAEISGNARGRHHGRQTRYGCKICDAPICSDETCGYFYHRVI
jgi:hypothetical protein